MSFTVAPVAPGTVAKRYAEGRVLIHYHAEIHRRRDPRPEMLCAVFYHAASKVVLSPDAGVIFGKLNRVTDPAGCDQRSWQQPVLVEVVDVVEDGQRVNPGTLPSITRVEWLKSLNLPDPCWIDAAQVLPDRRSPVHGVLDAWEGGAPVR
jgi:hypothetical protein